MQPAQKEKLKSRRGEPWTFAELKGLGKTPDTELAARLDRHVSTVCTEIEFFQGGHAMRAEGTFDMLHRHLRWPRPARTSEK